MSRYVYKSFGRQLPPLTPRFDLVGRRSGQAASAASVGPDSDGAGSHGYGSLAITAYDDECCPPVVDPFTLLALLGLIAGGALALFGLFQQLFGRRRRRSSLNQFEAGLEWFGLQYVNTIEHFFHLGGEEKAMQMMCKFLLVIHCHAVLLGLEQNST